MGGETPLLHIWTLSISPFHPYKIKDPSELFTNTVDNIITCTYFKKVRLFHNCYIVQELKHKISRWGGGKVCYLGDVGPGFVLFFMLCSHTVFAMPFPMAIITLTRSGLENKKQIQVK